MRLHANALSGNSYKIRLLLAQLGRTCELVPVDIFAGESRTPEFLARNPAGQTPVLELEDGTFLAESNAILCYLADGTALFPTAPMERAQTLRWMFFEQNRVMPNIAWARFIRRFLPEDHALRSRLAMLENEGRDALEVLERHLDDRRFVVGERYTIADIALFGYGHTATEAGITLDGLPRVRAWLDSVRAQPEHLHLEA